MTVSHGTWQCYRRTRCARPECLAAWQRYKKGRVYARHLGVPPTHTDSTGTHRRIQALMFMGYSGHWLAHELGWKSNSDVVRLLQRPTVNIQTAERVKRVYDEYAMTPGPRDRWANRVRSHARAKGYLSPLNWDDDEIDDPEAKPRGLGQRKGYCQSGRHPKLAPGRCPACRAEWFAENPDWHKGKARRVTA